MKTLLLRALTLSIALIPSAAFAHAGAGAAHGFEHGIQHPFGGVDHLLAMIAVGIFAARLGGRALLLVPLSFVALMAIGGTAGFAEIRLPYVEIAIALSVVVLGVFVAFRTQMPLIAAIVVVSAFAFFHGHAHGAELPDGESPFPYAAGFLIATAMLHAAGIALGIAFEKLGTNVKAQRYVQAGGSAIAIAGVLLLTRALIS
jgi:urease accessory protein